MPEGQLGNKSVFAKARLLSSRGGKLTAAECAEFSDIFDQAVKEASDLFEAVVKRSRERGESLWLSVDLEQGYRQLASVHPALRPMAGPSEVDADAMQLDEMEGAAYDVARRAERMREWYKGMMTLWEAEWQRYAIGRNAEERAAIFKRVMYPEYSNLAELDAFLIYEKRTKERVSSVYSKVSRRLETLRQITGGVREEGWRS